MDEDQEPLYDGQRPLLGRMLVSGEPTSSARILLLLQSVTRKDMGARKVLSGYHQSNLCKILEKAQIDPTTVYVAPAVGLPALENPTIFIEDVERFSPLLQAQLDAIPSIEVIFALGNMAVKAAYTLQLGGKFTMKEADQDDIRVRRINGVRKKLVLPNKRKLTLVAAFNLLYRTEQKYQDAHARALRAVAATLLRMDRKRSTAPTRRITDFFAQPNRNKREREDSPNTSVSKRQHTLVSQP